MPKSPPIFEISLNENEWTISISLLVFNSRTGAVLVPIARGMLPADTLPGSERQALALKEAQRWLRHQAVAIDCEWL